MLRKFKEYMRKKIFDHIESTYSVKIIENDHLEEKLSTHGLMIVGERKPNTKEPIITKEEFAKLLKHLDKYEK